VRKSTVSHPHVLENAFRWGGLVEFYNSPERKKWTPSGRNVPHYPALSGIWWTFIARAVTGELTPQEAMTGLARAQDDAMAELRLEKYAPILNPPVSRNAWLNRPGAPKPERKPQKAKTIAYDELIKQWKSDKGIL
jgi:glycerol transport system substrate-binding protein